MFVSGQFSSVALRCPAPQFASKNAGNHWLSPLSSLLTACGVFAKSWCWRSCFGNPFVVAPTCARGEHWKLHSPSSDLSLSLSLHLPIEDTRTLPVYLRRFTTEAIVKGGGPLQLCGSRAKGKKETANVLTKIGTALCFAPLSLRCWPDICDTDCAVKFACGAPM